MVTLLSHFDILTTNFYVNQFSRDKYMYIRPIFDIKGFGGFSIWPLMSTHFWDENPMGNWTLTIRYCI